MIKFTRYEHVNDLVSHYIEVLDRDDIAQILIQGINNTEDAELFSKFIWQLVGQMNEDEENEVVVLGSVDNSEMIPDIHYEITKLMRDSGFYGVWESVSEKEM
ncbi:hypothetical protein ACJJID_16650 [Microbulbifer sp. CnH-101-G]|uniref:hypothetical protein n=1 Tax=Microbulbifer sp. CnH-101-G TaxID=3243393 RepID=UPI00403A4CCD